MKKGHDGYKSQPRANGKFAAKAKPALTPEQEKRIRAFIIEHTLSAFETIRGVLDDGVIEARVREVLANPDFRFTVAPEAIEANNAFAMAEMRAAVHDELHAGAFAATLRRTINEQLAKQPKPQRRWWFHVLEYAKITGAVVWVVLMLFGVWAFFFAHTGGAH